MLGGLGFDVGEAPTYQFQADLFLLDNSAFFQLVRHLRRCFPTGKVQVCLPMARLEEEEWRIGDLERAVERISSKDGWRFPGESCSVIGSSILQDAILTVSCFQTTSSNPSLKTFKSVIKLGSQPSERRTSSTRSTSRLISEVSSTRPIRSSLDWASSSWSWVRGWERWT